MGTVLVVEGDPTVRSIVGRLLARIGHRTIEVQGGSDGLAHFQAFDVDLVVTDTAPDPDGARLIDRIRDLDRNVPIIAIASREDPRGLHHDGMLVGATVCIGRPFSPEDLAAAVTVLLSGDRHRRGITPLQ